MTPVGQSLHDKTSTRQNEFCLQKNQPLRSVYWNQDIAATWSSQFKRQVIIGMNSAWVMSSGILLTADKRELGARTMLKAIYTPMSGALAQEKVLEIIARRDWNSTWNLPIWVTLYMVQPLHICLLCLLGLRVYSILISSLPITEILATPKFILV